MTGEQAEASAYDAPAITGGQAFRTTAVVERGRSGGGVSPWDLGPGLDRRGRRRERPDPAPRESRDRSGGRGRARAGRVNAGRYAVARACLLRGCQATGGQAEPRRNALRRSALWVVSMREFATCGASNAHLHGCAI